MILTLTITASSATKPGEAVRHVFTEDGGTIGRAAGSSWVLTQNKVSGRHATISFRDGVFYIMDTSRNGVSVNSPHNRLVSGRPYALKPGDRILIEPYEIDVAIDSGAVDFDPLLDPLADGDPFAPAPAAGVKVPDLVSPMLGPGAGEVDPLKFFDPLSGSGGSRPPKADVQPPDDWHLAHYSPPVARPDPDAPLSGPGGIPQGYNPLAPDEPLAPPPARPPARTPAEPTPAFAVPRPGASRIQPPAPVAPVRPPPEPERPIAPVAPPLPLPRLSVPPSDGTVSGTLNDVLAGAGLPSTAVTPELAQNIGQIVRVVVSGLMDILQARQRIKDEFGMDRTVFRPADNNPLKFSANVEDALHNLLVKRNAAYLGPVDAFADAFNDLRDHQLAMLAGMRVAFESMLADFDPDRLQQEFDRQIAKGGGLALVPGKLRYWDLFREKRRDMTKDPEATFAALFGDDFAQAYEEQLEQLKARRRE